MLYKKLDPGRLGSLAAMAIGLFFLLQALKLNIGTLSNPGAGLWPLVLSAVLIVSSASSLRRGNDAQEEEGEGLAIGTWHAVLGAASIALFILMFEHMGLTVPSFLLLLFWMRALGKEQWRSSVVAALAFTVFSVVVFVWGIDAPFPDDVLLTRVWGNP